MSPQHSSNQHQQHHKSSQNLNENNKANDSFSDNDGEQDVLKAAQYRYNHQSNGAANLNSVQPDIGTVFAEPKKQLCTTSRRIIVVSNGEQMKRAKLKSEDIKRLIKQCVYNLNNLNEIPIKSNERVHQMYATILILRILGRICEHNLFEVELGSIDSILCHLGLSEFARSGLSSRTLKILIRSHGSRIYSRRYAFAPKLEIQELSDYGYYSNIVAAKKKQFSANYSLQRTAKYIAALQRYEDQVRDSAVPHFNRAQDIGTKLNRIASYAQQNGLVRLESRCRRRGLALVNQMWQTLPITFESNCLLSNSDSRKISDPERHESCNNLIWEQEYLPLSLRSFRSNRFGLVNLPNFNSQIEFLQDPIRNLNRTSSLILRNSTHYPISLHYLNSNEDEV